MVEYSEGSISAIDEEGGERKVSINRIDTIVFEHSEQADPSPGRDEPADHSPAEDEVLSPSEVLADISKLEDKKIEIEGRVSGTDSAFGTASDENFVIVLDGNLRVKIHSE